ncbi:folylpolyglutamate synthase, mitochondrial-like isoform X2 [Periplaneta americana]|uniref:folylpolyglutamate synthase, mitochondrial-like isoform X2 n=1 Tax=Periplaneta americana TaxID=6978 RepID=UPI0037E75563
MIIVSHVDIINISTMDYKKAVTALNSLQTNTAVLQETKNDRSSLDFQVKKFEKTVTYLERSGINLEKLDELSVIHVTGTKGKGSTCAFTESILRHHGYRTGFYSSPHLVAVRERIRIDGQPLSQQDFARYFWKVHNSIKELKETEKDMPPYFLFLTVMAFNVFLWEKVDVAIVEVGIGGEFDSTNILRKVPTIGITSLGLDHTSLLGNTIEEIAWQKAGIMKPGSITFTADQQQQAALEVLKERAIEKKSTLLICPPLESYDWSSFAPQLENVASVQVLNASLAIQLANAWMWQQTNGVQRCMSCNGLMSQRSAGASAEQDLNLLVAPSFPITSKVALGLRFCSWPGRNQIIHHGLFHYFLDGAHTVESLWFCADWFIRNSGAILNKSTPFRVLIFNCTGDRDPKTLLMPLLCCGFHLVVFCPNTITTSTNSSSDQANYMTSITQQLKRCRRSQEAWCELQQEIIETEMNAFTELCYPVGFPNISKRLIESCNSSTIDTQVKLFPCVSDTLAYLEKKAKAENHDYHIFVTGSLHLVGAVLSILDPDLTLTPFQLSGDMNVSKTASVKLSS